MSNELGRAALSPADPVVAGSRGTWTLTYTAGSRPIQPGGRLRIYCDSDTDRAQPQFADPAAPDYTTVTAPEGVRIDALVVPYKTLMLTLNGAPLLPGEQVVVTYGDSSGGSPGLRSQTFLEGRHYYLVSVSPSAGAPFEPLPDPPHHAIVGGDAARLHVIAPSTAAVGRPFRLLVKAEDAWGNPATLFRGRVALASDAIDLASSSATFTEREAGLFWLEGCRPTRSGVFRIEAAGEELRAHSNPVEVTEATPDLDLFWGDYHGGQVENAEKIADFFRYARDAAGIQFASYQRNDTAHSDADYAIQTDVERAFHEPGRFVAIPGYEWSPETRVGGHHNVYFRRFDQPMRRWSSARLKGHDTSNDLPHVRDLYAAYRNTDTVITPHVGGNHSNLTWHEPTLEPAVEITSDHGSFEWMLEEILDYDYRMGFFGGSDSHTGRPGADSPGHQHRRYAKSGLAGVYATEVSIDALLDALQARRCFATTGARILVRTACEGHPMGSEFATRSAPEIHARVAGTAPIESVELYRGRERLYTHAIASTPRPTRVRVVWEGASRRSSYSGVVWEGCLAVRDGRMSGLRRLRFDSPRSYVHDETSEGLSWYSVTCGYRSGLIFDLDTDEAELFLTVSTQVMTGPKYEGHGEAGPLRISLAPAERIAATVGVKELADGPRTIEIGHLSRRVTVSLAPEPVSESVDFVYTDTTPSPGVNPYWLRVVQVDQEMAWSSPIWVDYQCGPEGPR